MLLLLLLILPNIALYMEVGDLSSFLLSILLYAFLLSVLKNTKYLIIFTPFYFIIPFAIYYIYFYGSAINEQIVGIVLETNNQELLQFLGYRIFIYLFLFLVYFFLIIYLLYKNSIRSIVWEHRSRSWVLIVTSIFIVFIILINSRGQLNTNEFVSDNFLSTEKNDFIQEIKKTYPIGLVVSFYDFYQEQKKINHTFEMNKNYQFNIKENMGVNKTKQIYILVIGETSRRHNWSLSGYNRKTNPLLYQQKNLVYFDNMISISSATRSSIPMIITRKPAQQVFQYDFPERSIISAFKEVGFSTYWISTQQKFGAFDTSTSVYAKEADYMLFLNKTSYTNKGETDEVILPELKKAIEYSGNKKFIVIHTLGSHYNYIHRYTKDFNVFRPSLNDIDHYSLQDKKNKTQLTNSYDNSILYTDYVLNKIIETLKNEKNTESFLFYSSDHGEDLFDNDCEKSGHGNTTIYNYEIAAFAWYSDLYQEKNSEKINWLKRNKQRKINQTSIFPTLIDAANLKIPNDSLDKSILKDFRDYPRLVSGGVDFDKTQSKGICKEIQ